MAITRNTLNNPLLTEEQRIKYEKILEKNMACDAWTTKALKNVGVLLTSHPANRAFLKSSLRTHKALDFWTVVFYDNYWRPDRQDIKFEKYMPDRETFDLADNFVISKQQDWGGVIFPYFWMMKFGLQMLTCFEYIYHANGDCVVEKPENFSQLLEMMGDADFFPVGWDDTEAKPMCNTTGFIIKSKWVKPMIEYIQERFIPFENYEKYSAKLGSGEVRFADAVLALGMKLKKPDRNPYNLQLSIPGGTWFDIIGFRHIHGEYKEGMKEKTFVMIPWQYIDNRYL